MTHHLLMTTALAAVLVNSTTQAEQTQYVEEVISYGRAQQFYLEKQTTIGSKIDLQVLNLPQSAQILSSQLIRDQAARDITDLYRSIAGVSEFFYSSVSFRGFRDNSNVFYDGVRGDPYAGGINIPQLFNIERVEVLKGPAAALYGGGEPGGMINYVTKKPSFDQQTEVTLIGGNYNTLGGSLESTGALSENIAYRLGTFYEEADSFRNNADSVNLEIAGGLLFELGERTRLTTTFDYINTDLGGQRFRGVPVDDDGNFLVAPSYNTAEKFDFQDLEAIVLQATLEHTFNDNVRNTTTLCHLDNERFQKYHEPRGFVDVNGDDEANVQDGVIRREYRDQDRENQEVSLTTDFVVKFSTGSIEHQFLFGGDYHDVDTEFENLRARYENGVRNLNIFAPNYGETDRGIVELGRLSSGVSVELIKEGKKEAYRVKLDTQDIHSLSRYGEIEIKRVAATYGKQRWDLNTLNKNFNGHIELLVDPVVGEENAQYLDALMERCEYFSRLHEESSGSGSQSIKPIWRFDL